MLNLTEQIALTTVEAVYTRAMAQTYFSESLYHAHAEAVKLLAQAGYSEAFMQRLYSQQLDILSKPDAAPTVPTRMVEDNGDRIDW